VGRGIYVSGGAGITIRSTDMSGVTAGDAINIRNQSGPVDISIGKIEGVSGYGINYVGTTNGTIAITNITGNGRIYVEGGREASITGVPTATTGNGGIEVKNVAGGVSINGTKTARSGTGDGISITGGSSVTITDAQIKVSGSDDSISITGGSGSRTISNVTSNGRVYVNGGSSATITNAEINGNYKGGIEVRDVVGLVRIDGNKTIGYDSDEKAILITGGSGTREVSGVTVIGEITVDAPASSAVRVSGVDAQQ